MIAANDLSDLLYILYSIGDDQQRWPEFIERLTAITESDGVALVTHDLRSGAAQGLWSAYDETESQRFLNYYSRVNPWIPKERPDIIAGGTVTNGDVILPFTKMRRTEFYNDWGKKNDVVFSIGVNLGVTAGQLRYLCLNRGERTGPSSEKAVRLMEMLVKHVQKADQLQEILGRLGDFRRILDSLDLPVFLLDRDGKVLDVSVPGKIYLEDVRRITLDLEISAFDREGIAGHRMIGLPPGFEGAAVLMRANALYGAAPQRYVLVWLQTSAEESRPLSAASKLYNLTPAEVRFVQALLRTGSLDLTLEELHITRNTGRTHMRSVFNKTSSRRQGQVIQLFSLLGRIR